MTPYPLRGYSSIVKDGIVRQLGSNPGDLDIHYRPGCFVIATPDYKISGNGDDAAALIYALLEVSRNRIDDPFDKEL